MTNHSRKYINGLTTKERRELARQVMCNEVYLYQIGKGFENRNPSIALAFRLQKATEGRIRVEDFVNERVKSL
jgi:hypothetical protein